MNEVTRLLSALDRDDPQTVEKLLPLVYDELRQLAAQRLARENPGHTLEATALVHEAFLRLAGAPAGAPWASREHFFSVAAEAMRRILIDNARRKGRQKRGGGLRRQDLDQITTCIDARPEELLQLDDAICRLAELRPQSAELVRLRFFAGLTNEQSACELGISPSTADRQWAYARAWLLRELQRDDG